MKIDNCNFCCHETLLGLPSNGLCSLLPEYYNNGLDYRFLECEQIPMIKCPYKLYVNGFIDKEELNKRVMSQIERKTT